MSRRLKTDFEELIEFISKYSLKRNIENEKLKIILKSIHKKYYSLCVFVSEIDLRFETEIKVDVLNRIKETCSDISSCMLLFVHGMYKQAYMSLRSSIENFIKAIGCEECPCILEEKNVSTIFHKVKHQKATEIKNSQTELDTVKECYSVLCAYVHTKCLNFMTHIDALNNFPYFDQSRSSDFLEKFNSLVKIYIYIFVVKYRKLFFKFDCSNRELILMSIDKKQKKIIHEGNGD